MARWSPIERNARARFGVLLAGVDEVGRGPLAGPVVACAVVMPPPSQQRAIAGVNDSKQLSAVTRERLAVEIRRHAVVVALGAASSREVDQLNVYHATVLAMRRALRRATIALGRAPDHVLLDGKSLRTLGYAHTAVVRGDAKCYAIACASIVAKVTRDRLMARLATRYPQYAWDTNVGYGTQFHRDAVELHGLTVHHRRSFCLDAQVSLDLR